MIPLRLQGLSVSIAGLPVCRGLDLDIGAGTRWAILGRNGTGKTTLLKTMAGLHPADAGAVLMEDRPLAAWSGRRRGQRLGMLFQDQETLFSGTVLETALIGRHPYLGNWEWEGPDDVVLARAALDEVGLAGMEGRSLATLSGGERQRLAVAILLCQAPEIYLLDEPTNHLDPHHQIEVLDTVCRRIGGPRGCAAIMVLHDVNLAARYCDHVLLLHGGGAFEHGPTGDVLGAASLGRLYGHPMVSVPSGRGEFYFPG